MKKIKTHGIMAIMLIACLTITLPTNVKADETWDPMIYDSSEVGDPPGNNNGIIDYYEAINAVQDYFNDIINYSQAMDVVSLYKGDIIYIDNNAESNWYDETHFRSIQEGVDAAVKGDTVYVLEGTYYENIDIEKSINLIGQDNDHTIIFGGVLISNTTFDYVYDVSISGFTVQHSRKRPWEGIGIALGWAKNCTICDNRIINNKYGIEVTSTSENNIIYNNFISKNKYGIEISGGDGNNNIYHNDFIGNEYAAFGWNGDTDTWYNISLNEGNYWDSYHGPDEDENGIGDVPYIYTYPETSVSVTDLYPLMDPYIDYDPEPNLEITIKKGYSLGKVKIEVKNTGGETAYNVNLSISINYGFLNKTKTETIQYDTLNPDESKIVTIKKLRGFGSVDVIASAKSDFFEVWKSGEAGRIFLFLIKL